MAFLKKHWMKIAIVLVILIIIYCVTNKKDKESGYVRKCPCPGVQQPGGGMYYNVACCKKAVGLSGSATGTGTGVA